MYSNNKTNFWQDLLKAEIVKANLFGQAAHKSELIALDQPTVKPASQYQATVEPDTFRDAIKHILELAGVNYELYSQFCHI